MKRTGFTVLMVVACAGMARAADEPVAVLAASHGMVRQAAHIYYNLATGERVVTLLGDDQTAGADTGMSVPLWSCVNNNACASEGYTTEYFFGADNPGTTSLSTAIEVLDYGDIATDTVVDCVHINWVSAHEHTDSDGDGVGDGVEGLAGRWTIWDADNGRAINQCMRLPLISITLLELPGNVMDAGSLSKYTADIDLVSTFSSSLAFEIGDTDGDLQGAAYGNNDIDTNSDGVGDGVSVGAADRDFDGLPDSDLDDDGLFDWSWTVRFYQPGTEDFDSDGNPDGTPAPTDADTIGLSFAVPDGMAVNNGDGTWTWDIDTTTLDAGTGEEDRFVLYDPDGNYAGGFNFGGFACEGDPLPDGPGYTPFATFEMSLYGPTDVGGGPCHPDLNADGVLNFFDVSLFIQQYGQGGDYNGDGSTNFFDVSLFIQEYNAGCP